MVHSKTKQDGTRTVRFKKEELEQIEQFLSQNSFFDFSTLTRVAIRKFIAEPDLKIIPVKPPASPKRKKTSNQEVLN